MLISGLQLIGTHVLSLHVGGAIAQITNPIIDPNDLRVVAFEVSGPQVGGENGNILETKSIREFSEMGMIVDSIDELVKREDIVRLDEIMKLNFHLFGLKVVGKTGRRIGKVEDFTTDPTTFQIVQLIVKRSAIKGFLDPELIIGRSQIYEVTDDKIILKDENEKSLRNSNSKDFVPNFVNPFRKEPNFAPAHNQTPDEEDTE